MKLQWLAGLLAACTIASIAQAQAAPAQTSSTAPAQEVSLGRSAVDLFGPWRFHIGDDPAWAQPNLNDSGWEQVDLRSPDDVPDPELGQSAPVPGWTALGHPNSTGYAWYRLRLDVRGANKPLAIKMPDSIDDAYQFFVNGTKIGEFGHFGRHTVLAYSSQPREFRLPAGVRSGPIVLAIRVWMDSASPFSFPDAGGLHDPPMLGLASTVQAQTRLAWDSVIRRLGSGFLEDLVLLLALVVAFTHFRLDRGDRAYLWLGLVCLVTLLSNLILQLSNFTSTIPQTGGVLARDVVLAPLRIGFWVFFWSAWFGLRPQRWLQRTIAALVLILAAGTAMLRPPLHGEFIPLTAATVLVPLLLAAKLGLAVLLIWITVRGIHEDRAEGWFTLPAILLAIVANYQTELLLLHLHILYKIWGFRVSLGQISTVLSLLLITLMGSRRFLLAQRRKVQWRLEVEQAAELQQLIVPTSVPRIPGLRIESVYRPSRQVSGDFFQVIPHPHDGSVLVVVGDVTGKGLKAGMLVALIIGTIDAAARESASPEYLLNTLNDRLCERGYATATCLTMRIARNGRVALANAGHLPPYLNGQEVATEGALPLGMLPGAGYETVYIDIEEGDALTLMTDGVVEATDERGELFGFDRLHNLIARHATAEQIAEAAQRFGQEDDILVLRVERPVTQAILAAAVA